MVRTEIVATGLSKSGIATTLVAAHTDDNMFINTGRTFVIINNADVAEKDVTFVTPLEVDGQGVADKIVAIPATSDRLIGPFPPALYNQTAAPDIGKVHVNFEDFADATIAVFEPPSK